jgi:hypothetical protein
MGPGAWVMRSSGDDYLVAAYSGHSSTSIRAVSAGGGLRSANDGRLYEECFNQASVRYAIAPRIRSAARS